MPLGADEARRVYDRIGRLQDTQRFYEDAATSRLARLAELDHARSVFELGCGTGRFAEAELRAALDQGARYTGVEISPRMAALARRRLAPWAPRARVELIDPPGRALPGEDGGFDRFLAAYVFDLLSTEDARALLAEARRLLSESGLLGVVSLTHGTSTAGRLVSRTWGAVSRRWPSLLGGCRPIELSAQLGSGGWRLRHRDVVVRFGISSEVVVAERA
jgi:ubiquinone/menaquinone biosynthesis C-methylase UbiE